MNMRHPRDDWSYAWGILADREFFQFRMEQDAAALQLGDRGWRMAAWRVSHPHQQRTHCRA